MSWVFRTPKSSKGTSVCFHTGLSLSRKSCPLASTFFEEADEVQEAIPKSGLTSLGSIFRKAFLPRAQSSRSDAKRNKAVGCPRLTVAWIKYFRTRGIISVQLYCSVKVRRLRHWENVRDWKTMLSVIGGSMLRNSSRISQLVSTWMGSKPVMSDLTF